MKIKAFCTWKNLEIFAGGLLIFALLFRFFTSVPVADEVLEDRSKEAEIIVFGEWTPDSEREILATLESAGDMEIKSDIAGTIDQVFVEIGEQVQEGQVLASFRLENDSTQVTYENALRNLEVVRMSGENSIRSAEITLDTAEREREQTNLTQEQTKSQVFESF